MSSTTATYRYLRILVLNFNIISLDIDVSEFFVVHA